jgi:hypothetical protein
MSRTEQLARSGSTVAGLDLEHHDAVTDLVRVSFGGSGLIGSPYSLGTGRSGCRGYADQVESTFA